MNRLLLASILLAGCGGVAQYGVTDKKEQQVLFFKCMESLPAGPVATKYNDWAEVVDECGVQSRSMTWGCVKNCG